MEEIKELQERLLKNVDKAITFAESNTKRNTKGQVLWDEDEDEDEDEYLF